MSKPGAILLCSIILLVGLSAPPAMCGPVEVIAKYDKDGDKTLDLAEVEAAAGAYFDKLETDGDGTLDERELKGILTSAEFKEADTDHDGTLSRKEYLALVRKLFKEADADHEGTLDVKELGSKAGLKLVALIGG
jgi:hypothetical protein